MQNLPTATTYEKEFTYMPWGILIKEVQAYVIENTPRDGKVLDLLCGPGYLLGRLQQERQDLKYLGIDLELEFITHAQKQYPKVSFEVADAFTWDSKEQYEVVLVTAGLHHLPYKQQEPFIEKISKIITQDGIAIIGDPYIDDFNTEEERKIAGAKLGYEYLLATIKNKGPDDIIDAAVEVLRNDVKLIEWKSSINKIKPIFEKHFSQVEMHKTWPDHDSQYGDYYFILRK